MKHASMEVNQSVSRETYDQDSVQSWDDLLMRYGEEADAMEVREQINSLEPTHARAMANVALGEVVQSPELEQGKPEEATVRDLGSLAIEYAPAVSEMITQIEEYLIEAAEESSEEDEEENPEDDQRDFNVFWHKAGATIEQLMQSHDSSVLSGLPSKYRQLILTYYSELRSADKQISDIEQHRMIRHAAIGYAAVELGEDSWFPAEL